MHDSNQFCCRFLVVSWWYPRICVNLFMRRRKLRGHERVVCACRRMNWFTQYAVITRIQQENDNITDLSHASIDRQRKLLPITASEFGIGPSLLAYKVGLMCFGCRGIEEAGLMNYGICIIWKRIKQSFQWYQTYCSTRLTNWTATNIWRYEKTMVTVCYYSLHILHVIFLNISKYTWPT